MLGVPLMSEILFENKNATVKKGFKGNGKRCEGIRLP